MRTAGHGLTTNTHARMLFLSLLSHASAWLKARRPNSMLSQVDRLLGASPCMDVRIHLCKESSADAVAGQVVLASDTQLDIATVAIRLSGSATSRVHSGRLSESHQLFNISEQLFPPSKFANSFSCKNVTLPPGEHVFAFSIKLPQTTQHKTSKRSQLPPSTGDKSSPEEIKYVLEATVRQNGFGRGLLRGRKATRSINIPSQPNTTLPSQPQIQAQTRRITSTAGTEPSTCEARAKLNGPFLVLNNPIPLSVEIANISTDSIYLHDFQTMLFETTDVRAKGHSESHTRSWVVQTMANLQQPFVPEIRDIDGTDGEEELVFSLDKSLWSRYIVPPALSPSFETSNIRRRYRLEIRLGIRFGGNNVSFLPFYLAT
ncbi:hypothetical protein ASPVEDRAFT_752573 [Aspergillus versicolor CBS 583.65]|uniref:Arrestin-like N-terminal domain-containing protein n=1 Tax=Aspergillus versicolor CBS 583.65 TaxID=1036611 RepID=A0A1L9PQM1_ASPVE|nr:uncharacterized protein ASPVEDRAFT_752573 [Aspergillus versicolor CBS 583.65]OJJ03745.1 hypothetical protein ASPVEDRAFT_752573 [Aspergillus versicolor CBS 583.65]